MRIKPYPYSILTFVLVIVFPFVLTGMNGDTVDPTITSIPRDTIVDCDRNIEAALQNWYDIRARMQGEDNSGVFTLEVVQSYAELLAALELSKDTLCNPNAIVIADYFILDSCSNSSDTLSASFSVVDNDVPIIKTLPSSVDYSCSEGIQDSLIAWLVNKGGAVVEDECADSIIWTNYFWNDNLGNSGFVLVGDEADILIQRQSCQWEVTVSFFVSDPCGNSNVTNGVFRIVGDSEDPVLDYMPADTILPCFNINYYDEPTFFDTCDPTISVEFDESNTQSTNILNCGYFNYTITRKWTATDVCGNFIETEQKIEIVDTVAPTAVLENFILLDCNEDIDSDFEDFISGTDDCSSVEITFEDGPSNFFSCQEAFERTWITTDICGNSSSYLQMIQLQDLSGPLIDTIAFGLTVFCGAFDEVSNSFDTWLSNAGGSRAYDDCGLFEIYPRFPNSYNITNASSIRTAATASLQDVDCNPVGKRVVQQEVDFVYLDTCDNATFVSAVFQVFDTLAPSITVCNEDLVINVSGSSCDTIVTLPVPEVDDDCSFFGKDVLTYSFKINDGVNIPYVGSITETMTLDVGVHTLEYFVFDCAGNSSSCIQTISILDAVPPQISCPEDVTFILPVGQCEMDITLPPEFTIVENCKAGKPYSQVQPEGEGYVNFTFNNTLDTFAASSIFLTFTDNIVSGDIADPQLEIFFSGNTSSSNEYFTLFSEVGENLGIVQLNQSRCNSFSSSRVSLNKDLFLTWIGDERVFFTLTPNEENTDGINPCIPLQAPGLDSLSILKATLSYTDINPEIMIRDSLGNGQSLSNPGEIVRLGSGNFTSQYTVFDASGNRDSCQFKLSIIDTEAPTITCSHADTIILEPSSTGSRKLEETDFNLDFSDNCGISTVSFVPENIVCSEVDDELSVEVEISDLSGNRNTCQLNIPVRTAELNPTFVSGLCLSDTLKLFANVDVEDPFGLIQYFWSGPNNFTSNIENPIVLNINEELTGVYDLEIVDAFGCVFKGALEIELNALDAPQITAAATTICDGESLLLNSNSFNESVDYLWYEGISPNGVLIDITSGPSIQLSPNVGTHFYYVDIEGENCNTNASTTLEIHVLDLPIAQVAEPFITVCEGDEITFSSISADPDFEYFWSGPSGYNSFGQFPEIINTAQLQNQGSYSLVIERGTCFSDTAIVQVVVFPQPPTPVISGENIFCEGSNFILSVDNIPTGQQYLWFKDEVLYSSIGSNNLIIPAAQSALSGNWTVVVQEDFCFSDTSSNFEIMVNPSLNIGATNDGPICQGDSVTISSSFIPGAQYSWSTPSGSILDGRILTISAEEGIYNLTVTTESNCSNVASTEVLITPVPKITALSNSSTPCIDENNTIRLVPTVFPPGVYDYSWSGPNGFSSTLESPSIINATPNDNGVYSLVIRDGNCDSEEATTEVFIELIPAQPEIFLASSVCEQDALVIQTNNSNLFDEYIWDTPKGQIINLVPELVIDPLELSDQGLYTLSVKNNDCSSVASEPLLVNVVEKPNTPQISGPSQICVGNTLSLSVDLVPNATYRWVGPNGLLNSQNSILEIQNVSEIHEGNYSVELQTMGCLSDNSLDFFVEILEQPDAPEFVETEIIGCFLPGEPIEICLEQSPGPNTEFLLFQLENDSLIQTSTDSCFVIGADDLSSNNLIVRQRIEDCISGNSNVLILNLDVLPKNSATFLERQYFLCGANQINVSVENADTLNLNWFASDPNVVINPSGSNAIVGFIEDEAYLYVSSSYGACENFGLDSVLLIKTDTISANDDFFTLEYNGSNSFDFLFNDFIKDEFFVELTLVDENIEAVFEDAMLTVESSLDFIGEAQVQYEICQKNCPTNCSNATISIQIGNNTDCFVSNLLTPNGDGVNDLLLVPCLNSNIYLECELFIFNQWGDEIYTASPYLNDWAGTFNGKTLPAGTYYYILQLKEDIKPLKGFLVIEK